MNKGNKAVYCLSVARFSRYQYIFVCFFIYFNTSSWDFCGVVCTHIPAWGFRLSALLSYLMKDEQYMM